MGFSLCTLCTSLCCWYTSDLLLATGIACLAVVSSRDLIDLRLREMWILL